MGLSSTASIILGCSVAVISSAIQSLGITLQRKSHLIPYHSLSTTHTHQYKRNMWLFGFILFIIANILGSLIQITTLPLIILSPLQSIGLIFNSILSCMLLPGEVFTRKLAIGTAIIAIGAFIIAFNGNTEQVDVPGDTDEKFAIIIGKLTLPVFLSWFIFTFIAIASLLSVNWILTKRRHHLKLKRQSRSTVKLLNYYQFAKGVNYGVISGTLTAHTFLFAKSLIDTIVETILSKSHFKQITANLTPYILLFVMLSIIGCQLTAFNLGLSQILTSILYPLCFLVYNLCNLINDVTFNSLIADHKMSLKQLTWVVLGLFGVLFGVILISWDSAFGSAPKDRIQLTSEDELILYSKFPYTDNEQRKTLLNKSSSSASLDFLPSHDSIDGPIASTSYSDDIDNTTTVASYTKPKRILSFEQNQLINLLDV